MFDPFTAKSFHSPGGQVAPPNQPWPKFEKTTAPEMFGAPDTTLRDAVLAPATGVGEARSRSQAARSVAVTSSKAVRRMSSPGEKGREWKGASEKARVGGRE